MLEPQRMDRVLIVGTRDVLETTINALHDLNLLHMEDYVEEEEYFHIGKPLKTVTLLSEKLLKLRSIKSYLHTKETLAARDKREKVLQEIDANLASLDSEVSKKTSERSSLESEIKELDRREETLKPFVALGLPLELLSGYESVVAFVGTSPLDVEPAVKAVTPDYELFSASYAGSKIIALFVPRAVASTVTDALMKGDFTDIEPLRESGDPAAIEKGIETRKQQIGEKLEVIKKELGELDEKFAQFILSSEELLTIDTQKAEAPLRFAMSDNTFIIDGWIPKPDYGRLKDTLLKATNDRVFLTQIEPEHKMYVGEIEAHPEHIEHQEVNAPVKYDNPKLMQSAQTFIDLYSRPKYDEIDPTAVFFFLFPAFYGLILGDVGYGLLLLIIGAGLSYKLKGSEIIQALTRTLILCSIFSIIFGFLFGEFLGFPMAEYVPALFPEHIRIGPIGPFSMPVERMVPGGYEAHLATYVFGVKDLLIFTCLVGISHLTVGFLLGFKNELKMHGFKVAVLHKISWLLFMYGGLAIVWYVFPLMVSGSLGSLNPVNPLFLVGVALAVVGVIMLLMGEGAMGIVEIPALMSNVLSYTRLLAVGLSSVGIAFVVNTIVGMLAGAGIIGLIVGVLVFLMGHTINLLLGIIAPGLHALRLHYVEFFTKFYKGGGRVYSPFGYLRKYTED